MIKKILIALLIAFMLCNSIPMLANIGWNEWKGIHTHPESKDINQSQYQKLFGQFYERLVQYVSNPSNANKPEAELTKIFLDSITNYLQTLNTPTSLRLLEDITRNGFYPMHFVFVLYHIAKKDSALWNELIKEVTTKTTIKDMENMAQLGDIIVMCWDSGIYGDKVQEQIIAYLKTIESKSSKKLLKWLK